jgi:hypothetical protein
MPRSLADYDSDRSQYARAEQPWVCGRACEGTPCYIGPDEKGRCQVQLECVPVLRGSRWQCTRPKAAGGKCGDGPLPDGKCPHCPSPCQPQRSLLSRRRVLTVFIASAALGSLLLFAGGESNKEFISPGRLSVHHHALQQRCTKCHTAEEGHAVVKTVGAQNAMDQSFKCIDCHGFGKHALRPHGLSAGQLSKSTHRIEQSDFHADPPAWMALASEPRDFRKSLGSGHDKDGRLACAVCHQEHRGARHDLKQISERRCQICHVKPFHAFSKDHAEFTNFPYKRRTRIHFDHGSHYGRHFGVFERLMPHGRKPDSCTTCHAPDPSGAKMLVRGFELSCASCHGREIQMENALPGVSFVQLPALDESVLQWNDEAVQRWPRTVKSGSLPDDVGSLNRLSPFMVLLLSTDKKFQVAQRTLDGVNLSKLQDAPPTQKQAIVDYASAIRRLIHDLGADGGPGLQKRLEAALGAPLDRPPFGSWSGRAAVTSPRSTGSLLLDAVRTAGDRWFPQAAKKKAAAPNGPQTERSDRRHRFGNWKVRDDDYSIRYRPRLHADPFLRFWLDASAADFARKPVAAMSTPKRALWRMFKQLADPAVPGSCVKCHTVDRQPTGKLLINWTGYRPQPYTHGFTRFSHHPHLKELGTGNKACETCHVRNDDVKLFHPQFIRRDWLPNFNSRSVLTGGFHAMKRQNCAQCHTPRLAGESCLQCHNYHVGHFPPRD